MFALVAGLRPAQNGMALHVPREQIPDIGHRKHIGIDDHGAALVAHQFRRHEARRGEGLQIVADPGTLVAVAQKEVALARAHERKILVIHDSDFKQIIMGGIAPQRVLRDQRTEPLLVIGLYENAILHTRNTSGCPPPGAVAGAVTCSSKRRILPREQRSAVLTQVNSAIDTTARKRRVRICRLRSHPGNHGTWPNYRRGQSALSTTTYRID